MKFDEKVRLATRILEPGSKTAIEEALERIEAKETDRAIRALTQSKDVRKKVSRFKAALIDVRAAFNQLPDQLRIPLRDAAKPFFGGAKAALLRNFMAPADTRIIEEFDSRSAVDVLISTCKRYEQKYRPEKPKRSDGFRQRLAAEEAYDLLVKYNKPTTTAKGGDFCRLAAILYGNKAAKLQRYCRGAAHDRTGSK